VLPPPQQHAGLAEDGPLGFDDLVQLGHEKRRAERWQAARAASCCHAARERTLTN